MKIMSETSYYVDVVVYVGYAWNSVLCWIMHGTCRLLPICTVVNILFACCCEYYNVVAIAYNFSYFFGSYNMK